MLFLRDMHLFSSHSWSTLSGISHKNAECIKSNKFIIFWSTGFFFRSGSFFYSSIDCIFNSFFFFWLITFGMLSLELDDNGAFGISRRIEFLYYDEPLFSLRRVRSVFGCELCLMARSSCIIDLESEFVYNTSLLRKAISSTFDMLISLFINPIWELFISDSLKAGTIFLSFFSSLPKIS